MDLHGIFSVRVSCLLFVRIFVKTGLEIEKMYQYADNIY